jgi:methyl-accepting chemotaxis protein
MGVLLYFNIEQISEKIEFARAELAGNQFQRPAVRLIKALADYQVALVTQQSSDLAAAKQEIDGLIHQLEEANQTLATKLGFTDLALRDAGLDNLRISEIRSKWESLQRTSNGTQSKPAADQCESLVSDLRSLISHAGDTSNLTLDPEMDSYYLADVTSVTAAQTLNRIGTARAMLEPLLKKGTIPAVAGTAITVFGAMFKESDFDRITGDLDTALRENAKSPRGRSPTLKASIEPALAQYKADVKGLLDLISTAGQGKAFSLEEFHRVSSRASQSSLDLWEKTLSELDGVLVMRIDGFSKYRLKILLGTFISLGLAIVVLFFTVRGVTRPLTDAITHVEYVSHGDLSRELPASYLVRRDEIGTLARAMQEMSVRLREMIGEISGGIGVLSSASSLLHSNSTQMTAESRHASDKAHSVSAAAEEMSSNITSVAAGMEQTTINLSHVALATEQMTSVISEIAQNSEKARGITDEATRQAARITEQMTELGVVAREIGKVTETITEISSQTNLLALNATIEAARAGTAGKGFAVVATEIKALAQQTAAATEDIKCRIAGVQSATAAGITEIDKVSKVILEVSAIVASIAAAIEEQSTATRDIARNIAEASIGVNDVNERVAQSSQVSKEIAKDIATVDQAASVMSDGSSHVRSSAEDLSRISSQLRLTVEKFRV